jgi:integrase
MAELDALRALHLAGDAAGLNPEGVERVGLHDLRHSFVALALAGTGTPAEVAEAARHASRNVTMTLYAGLTKDPPRPSIHEAIGLRLRKVKCG